MSDVPTLAIKGSLIIPNHPGLPRTVGTLYDELDNQLELHLDELLSEFCSGHALLHSEWFE